MDKIQNLIAKDRSEEAIQELAKDLNVFAGFNRVKLLLISARLKRIETARQLDTVKTEEYSRERTKINQSILHLAKLEAFPVWRKFTFSMILLISILSFLASIHLLQRDTSGLRVDAPRIAGNNLIFPLIKLEENWNKYRIDFIIPERFRESHQLSMKHLRVLLEDKMNSVSIDNITVNEGRIAKYHQGLEFTFPEKIGQYYIVVPMTDEINIPMEELQNALVIENTENDTRSIKMEANLWDSLSLTFGKFWMLLISLLGFLVYFFNSRVFA